MVFIVYFINQSRTARADIYVSWQGVVVCSRFIFWAVSQRRAYACVYVCVRASALYWVHGYHPFKWLLVCGEIKEKCWHIHRIFTEQLESSQIDHYQVVFTSHFFFTWLLWKRGNKMQKTLGTDRFWKIPIFSKNPASVSAFFLNLAGDKKPLEWMIIVFSESHN